VFSCLSGNLENICAGIIAKKCWDTIEHFVASTNVNDTVRDFLENGFDQNLPNQPFRMQWMLGIK
jgi:threonine synthase